jgi:hypothetical protein
LPKQARSTSIQVPTLIGCFFYLLKNFFCCFLNNLGCEEVRIIETKILLSTKLLHYFFLLAATSKRNHFIDY